MPTESALDDDEITKLLLEDARKSSARYASQGLSALLPKRPTTSNAPRPNTRFLKTLVREADSHNTKLKEREEAEARDRLRRIREEEEADRQRHGDGRERKRRRTDEGHREGQRSDHDRHMDKSRLSRSPHHRRRDHRDRDRDYERRSRRRNTSSANEEDYKRRRKRTNTSSDDESSYEPRNRHRRGGHALEEQREPHKPTKARNIPTEQRSPSSPILQNRPGTQRRASSGSVSSASTDPLTSFFGPDKPTSPSSPPLKKRGRGFLNPSTSTSNIDAHFSATFNPADTMANPEAPNAEEEDDDWSSALTFLKSRSEFRAKQAARMREAGFTEEEIARWEKSSTHASKTLLGGSGDARPEGDVDSVRWKRKGEEREWDVGKEETPEPKTLFGSDGASHDPEESRPRKKSGEKERKLKSGKGNDAWSRPQNGLLKQFQKALR